MNKEQIRQYIVSIIAGTIAFSVFCFYLFLRRGYVDLFIANKALASASIIMLAFVLLFGPLSRIYHDKWLIYRKEFGIVAFFLAILHTIISLFFLSSKFTLGGLFGKYLFTSLLGLFALILMLILFVLSFQKIIKHLNAQFWVKLQYHGVRIVGIFVILHLFLMKYKGWLSWFEKGGTSELAMPFLPPASLFAGSFGVFVLIVKVTERLNINISKKLVPVYSVFLIILWVVIFTLGMKNGI